MGVSDVFSVVLKAVGDVLAHIFPPFGGHPGAGTSNWSGPIPMYFTYDGGHGRLRPFIIICVLRMIMASAVLGVLSVVLKSVGDALGL